MGMQIPDELSEINQLPAGAIRLHLGSYHSVLAPRGSMQKNSLGEAILDELKANYDLYTDPKYGDNPDPVVLAANLERQAERELEAALLEFAEYTGRA